MMHFHFIYKSCGSPTNTILVIINSCRGTIHKHTTSYDVTTIDATWGPPITKLGSLLTRIFVISQIGGGICVTGYLIAKSDK